MDSPAQPRITVYRGMPGSSYVWSPFVTKLEARLRFAGITYTSLLGLLPASPRGKIPYLTVEPAAGSSTPSSTTPVTLSDTATISHVLSQPLPDLAPTPILPAINAPTPALSASTLALDTALRALLEDKLYFLSSHEKWTTNYLDMREHILGGLPWPVRVALGSWLRRGQINVLWGQGTGRLDAEERARALEEGWKALAGVVAESKAKGAKKEDGVWWTLGGEQPTEVDTTLYGFVVGGLISWAAPTTQKVIRSHPVLVEWALRIHEKYFPDYERWED